MKKTTFALLALICVLFTSCYSTRNIVARESQNIDGYELVASKRINHFLFWGLVPLNNPKENTIITNNDCRIDQKFTFLDGLLSGITLGIYGRSTTTYYITYDEQ